MESNPARSSRVDDGYAGAGTVHEHSASGVRSYDADGIGIAVASTKGWSRSMTSARTGSAHSARATWSGTLTCPCHLGEYDVRNHEVLGGPRRAVLRNSPGGRLRGRDPHRSAAKV